MGKGGGCSEQPLASQIVFIFMQFLLNNRFLPQSQRLVPPSPLWEILEPPNSFSCMQFLGKFIKMICWRSHLGEILDPPLHTAEFVSIGVLIYIILSSFWKKIGASALGKSWPRHWFLYCLQMFSNKSSMSSFYLFAVFDCFVDKNIIESNRNAHT